MLPKREDIGSVDELSLAHMKEFMFDDAKIAAAKVEAFLLGR